MKINKKNVLTTSLAATLAAAMIIGGGTVAYLQGQTNDVVNEFKTNKVTVDLYETDESGNRTDNQKFEIIPGVSNVHKDPKVSVNSTIPAYVYVVVTDETQKLVTYAIDEGETAWIKLDGFDNVYYREFTPAGEETTAEYDVLKGNVVSYSAALTNADMLSEDNTLKDGIKLSFKAYAVQKEPFNDPVKAFAAKDAAFVEGNDAFAAALKSETNEPIVLNGDVAYKDSTDNPISALKNKSINLNGNTLTVETNLKGLSLEGASLTIENGVVDWNCGRANVSVAMMSNGELTLKGVTLNTNATINVESSTDPATINIIDSTIRSTDYYCISTNATNNATGENVVINIENSTLVANEEHDSTNDSAAILFNIPGKLNIENSNITADRQAVIVRCGTANITDSTLTCTETFVSIDAYDNEVWGSGNNLPSAVLVVGNRSNANAYPHDATCTLTNTTLINSENSSRKPIVAAACNGHTTTVISDSDISNIVTQIKGENDNSNIVITSNNGN